MAHSQSTSSLVRRGSSPKTLEERFWVKVNLDGPIPEACPELGPCWIWTAYIDPAGYGRIRTAPGRHGGSGYAHIISYVWVNGPVPDTLELDHLCRVRCCVNPRHLEAVTHRENIRRGDAPAGHHARSTHCPNGHEYTAENTYVALNGNRSCRQCRRTQRHLAYVAKRDLTRSAAILLN